MFQLAANISDGIRRVAAVVASSGLGAIGLASSIAVGHIVGEAVLAVGSAAAIGADAIHEVVSIFVNVTEGGVALRAIFSSHTGRSNELTAMGTPGIALGAGIGVVAILFALHLSEDHGLAAVVALNGFGVNGLLGVGHNGVGLNGLLGVGFGTGLVGLNLTAFAFGSAVLAQGADAFDALSVRAPHTAVVANGLALVVIRFVIPFDMGASLATASGTVVVHGVDAISVDFGAVITDTVGRLGINSAANGADVVIVVVLAGGSNLFLSLQHSSTHRAMLAFGQTGLAAGGRNSSVDNLGVSGQLVASLGIGRAAAVFALGNQGSANLAGSSLSFLILLKLVIQSRNLFLSFQNLVTVRALLASSQASHAALGFLGFANSLSLSVFAQIGSLVAARRTLFQLVVVIQGTDHHAETTAEIATRNTGFNAAIGMRAGQHANFMHPNRIVSRSADTLIAMFSSHGAAAIGDIGVKSAADSADVPNIIVVAHGVAIIGAFAVDPVVVKRIGRYYVLNLLSNLRHGTGFIIAKAYLVGSQTVLLASCSLSVFQLFQATFIVIQTLLCFAIVALENRITDAVSDIRHFNAAKFIRMTRSLITGNRGGEVRAIVSALVHVLRRLGTSGSSALGFILLGISSHSFAGVGLAALSADVETNRVLHHGLVERSLFNVHGEVVVALFEVRALGAI